jgi:ABC-type dipeptide/oligopeptide/nickel transport system permease component
MAIVILTAMAVVLIGAIVDVAYAFLDPRIRLGS